MLDAVYVDTKNTTSIVAIRPKLPFKPIFQVPVTGEVSSIPIFKQTLSRLVRVSGGDGEVLTLPKTRLAWIHTLCS
jgi:hypothetical protein